MWAISFSYQEQGRAHKSSSLQASKLASQLLGKDLDVILGGHLDHGVLVYAVPFHGTPPTELLQWHTTQQVQSEQLRLMMSLAICTALSFCAPEGSLKDLRAVFNTSTDWVTAQQDLVHMAVHLGARLPTLVVASKAPTGGDSALMDLALRRDHTARQLLIIIAATHLEAHNVPDDLSASYLAWADCVKPLPLADLPSQLCEELHDYSDPGLVDLPMPDPCPPPFTEWLPRNKQPLPPSDFTPTSLGDLITEQAQQQIKDWVLQQLQFLLDNVDIEANGSAARRTSNVPLALGQDAFVPAARGIAWDLRQLEQGIVVPVDFEAPISSHLDLEYLHEQLLDWPDQELVSFLVEGVRYKADVDFQIVLLPHLISLKEGYGSLIKEVEKYTDAGWYGLSPPPSFPFVRCPKVQYLESWSLTEPGRPQKRVPLVSYCWTHLSAGSSRSMKHHRG